MKTEENTIDAKKKAIDALSALAQESRIDIFRLLVEAEPKGCMMTVIGEKLGLPHTTLFFHLQKLKEGGLVEREKQGRAVIYRVNYNAFVGVIQYLTENCCKQSDMHCRIEISSKQSRVKNIH